ncbi:fimbrillin family protein [Phocaeicola plebeius]|uniref:fimbrillin family protein n=1 Tax=Phocaeicola plebeius TaxID=310297 RepID=UPI0021AC81FA|nr:fimbrillin family protein [Phocaeicola plebeius]MCR8883068.1 fimbrillin family protein [Phocaeicola plebeius]MDM8285515.1 fimbrillin family protein [Phocaeicola plebeius]
MKKSFLMLGVAAMALASCTQNEVVEYADSRAIQFDNAFVNNSTRAEITGVGNLAGFYVFAGFGSNTSNVYNNTLVTRGGDSGSYTWTPAYVAYWQDGENYTFDAYAANAKIDDASVGTDGKLKFTDVVLTDGTNDILVAETGVSTVDASNTSAVELTFSHTLSKVKFTFETAIENVNFTIKRVSFNDVVNKGSYAGGVWTAASDKQAYNFGDCSAVVTNEAGQSTQALIVLPQQLSNTQTVTFILSATGALALDERTLTAKLPSFDLQEGYSYNFVATLTSENISTDPDDPDVSLKPIEFTINESTGISGWTDGGSSDLED